MKQEIENLQVELRALYDDGAERAEQFKNVMPPVALLPISNGTGSEGESIHNGGTLLIILDITWADMLNRNGFPVMDIGLSDTASSSVLQSNPEAVIPSPVSYNI